jgi:hypothetical protein
MAPRSGRHALVVKAPLSGEARPTPEPLRSWWRVAAKRWWVALGLSCVVVGLSSGVAFAHWTGTGGGTASSATGTMATPSVVAFIGGDAPSSALLPGGSGDVMLRINNPNAYPVTLTAIAANGSIVVSGASGTCTMTGVTTNFPSSPAIAVPAGSTLFHLSGAALMSLGSQSGCQGATFTIPVNVSFQK